VPSTWVEREFVALLGKRHTPRLINVDGWDGSNHSPVFFGQDGGGEVAKISRCVIAVGSVFFHLGAAAGRHDAAVIRARGAPSARP